MPPLRLRSKVRKLPNSSPSANTSIGRVKKRKRYYGRSLPAPTSYSDRGLHPALAHDWRGLSHPTLASTCIYRNTDEQTGHLPDDFDEEAEKASESGLWIMKFWSKNYKR
ncbi:MAG: hypothetical protein LQ345_000130 [Seirophora villosa]|nr:MAG: hypothetical protein LQ345_000130 [Seirophora villosa]